MIKQSAKSRKKYRENKKAQQAYWQEHRYCEICLFEGRGRVSATEVHEILFRSQGGKCEPDNEISSCKNDHLRSHFRIKPWLHREDLYKIKSQGGKQDENQD